MKALTKSLQLSIQLPLSSKHQDVLPSDNRPAYTQITDNIFLSGYLPANDLNFLKQNNITNIINCAYKKTQYGLNIQFPNIRYFLLPLRDNSNSEILRLFYSTIHFIETVAKGNILIHCIEGISRGPALLTGYLMWKKRIGKEEAIKLIKSKRDCIDLNLGFLIQLGIWENHIFNKGPQFFSIKPSGDITFILDSSEFDNLLKLNMPHNLLCIKYNRRLIILNSSHKNNASVNIDDYIYFFQHYDTDIREIKFIDLEDNEFRNEILNENGNSKQIELIQ